jgi:hypothetical protein
MTRSKKILGLVGLAAAFGTVLVSAQLSTASHVRPKGATPFRVPLVPAFKACATPNRTHGAPLAFPSCNPPQPESGFVTHGAPDWNGAAANSIGFVLLRVDAIPPEDVLITSSGSDVRCLPATAAAVCNSPNAADGPDYSGQVQGDATIRISDHYNGVGLNEAATVVDIPFPVNATCTNTSLTTIGGLCAVSTSANAVVPGSVKDNQRGIVEIGQIHINDGGADGQVATAPNTVMSRQGIFIP